MTAVVVFLGSRILVVVGKWFLLRCTWKFIGVFLHFVLCNYMVYWLLFVLTYRAWNTLRDVELFTVI